MSSVLQTLVHPLEALEFEPPTVVRVCPSKEPPHRVQVFASATGPSEPQVALNHLFQSFLCRDRAGQCRRRGFVWKRHQAECIGSFLRQAHGESLDGFRNSSRDRIDVALRMLAHSPGLSSGRAWNYRAYVRRKFFTEIFFAVLSDDMYRTEPKMGRSGPHARSYRPSTQR